MNSAIRLNDYSTVPHYNIKAVVQATGISPSTLRAWERRYGICQPQRSESGYRLYSDRDLAVIRWLKAQVEAGMGISHAAAWLDSLNREGREIDARVLPSSPGLLRDLRGDKAVGGVGVRSPASLRSELEAALAAFDEMRADDLLVEAFSLYPIELVGDEIVAPVLVDLGERWHRGELSITAEHYATSYLVQRMASLLRSTPNAEGRARVWVGCAPGEMHEAGSVLLALYLRRAGYRIDYLGQNLDADDLVAETQRHKPDVVLLSAATGEAAAALSQVAIRLASAQRSPTTLGFGGRVFVLNPELRDTIQGIYLGDSAHEAVEVLRSLLREGRKPAERTNHDAQNGTELAT